MVVCYDTWTRSSTVEQRLYMAMVGGSIPSGSTKNNETAKTWRPPRSLWRSVCPPLSPRLILERGKCYSKLKKFPGVVEWQTRELEVLMRASVWRFDSSRPDQKIVRR